MRDPAAPAPLLAKLTVAIDIGVRGGALAVAYTLIHDLWDEVSDQQANTDGLAGPIFAASLAYVAWSIFMLTTSARRWLNGSVGDAALIALIGGLSAVRLILIRTVADGHTWFTSGSWSLGDNFLMALAIASGTCAVVASIAAIQIMRSSADRVDAGAGKRRATPSSLRT